MLPRLLVAFGLGVVVAGGIAWFAGRESKTAIIVPAEVRPAERVASAIVPAEAPAVAAAAATPVIPPAEPVSKPPAKASQPKASAARSAAPARTVSQPPNAGPSAPAATNEAKPETQTATSDAVEAKPEEPVAAAQKPLELPIPLRKMEPLPPYTEPKREPRTATIPAGTIIAVRLIESLSSSSNVNGDTFKVTLDRPLVVNGLVLAERGSMHEGRIVAVERSGRVSGRARLELELTKLNTSDGQAVKIETETFRREAESGARGDATKVGVAAGIGAAIGAIAGGGKGAAIGAAIGGATGAGGVLATRGKEATLPAETRLSFQLKRPVTLTEKID